VRRLVVVGGGIAGLAGARAALAAAAAAGLGLRATVLEASGRAGGEVWTEEVDGTPIDWGPDSFIASKPRGSELAAELGLGNDLIPVAPGRSFLLRGGRLLPIPPGTALGVPVRPAALVEAVREGLLTLWGALRAAAEPALPPMDGREPSAKELARTRLGGEVADRLVEPLLRGVFGAPGSRIGAWAAFPQAAGARSLVLALRSSRPRPSFVSIRGGMGRLVDALVAELPAGTIRLNRAAVGFEAGRGGFRVRTSGGPLAADAVLVAAPAPAAAAVLRAAAPRTAGRLSGISYGASAVVLLRYPPRSLAHPLDGSGYLVDPSGPGVVAACSWLSTKWPHLDDGRGPWLRAVVTDTAALELPDDELRSRAAAEVGGVVRARAEPSVTRIVRWNPALPVFGPGHRDRVRSAVAALPPGIALAGASLGAVGVPDCIASGEEAARRLVGTLAGGAAGQ
jgi:protoporphyrinogen/coproporphyrinogen III oxidase